MGIRARQVDGDRVVPRGPQQRDEVVSVPGGTARTGNRDVGAHGTGIGSCGRARERFDGSHAGSHNGRPHPADADASSSPPGAREELHRRALSLLAAGDADAAIVAAGRTARLEPLDDGAQEALRLGPRRGGARRGLGNGASGLMRGAVRS